jgi:hypothetical protein
MAATRHRGPAEHADDGGRTRHSRWTLGLRKSMSCSICLSAPTSLSRGSGRSSIWLWRTPRKIWWASRRRRAKAPSRQHNSVNRRVNSQSSGLGVGSPLGCGYARAKRAAFVRIAARNTIIEPALVPIRRRHVAHREDPQRLSPLASRRVRCGLLEPALLLCATRPKRSAQRQGTLPNNALHLTTTRAQKEMRRRK